VNEKVGQNSVQVKKIFFELWLKPFVFILLLRQGLSTFAQASLELSMFLPLSPE
jgi:hypothetical protein